MAIKGADGDAPWYASLRLLFSVPRDGRKPLDCALVRFYETIDDVQSPIPGVMRVRWAVPKHGRVKRPLSYLYQVVLLSSILRVEDIIPDLGRRGLPGGYPGEYKAWFVSNIS